MGSGIATALIRSNISVLLKEINSTYLQKGLKTVSGAYLIHNFTPADFFESF